MTVSLTEWTKYRDLLAKLSQKAADEFRDAVWNKSGRWGGVGLGNIPREELIEYAYALATKYGEGTAALACEYYDAMAELSGVSLPSAVPAETATIGEVGKALNGAMKFSTDADYISNVVGRLTKQAGQDTTLQNSMRDGAQFAWIPAGETCAFCLTLASRGWQYVSKKSLKNGHAEHIHSNCDCAYAVRFNDKTEVEGYDPERYRKMYYGAEGKTPQERINSMRREAYAKDKKTEGSDNSELIRSISNYEKSIMKNPTESARLYKKDGSVVEFGGMEHNVIGDVSVLNEMEGGILTHNHPTDVTFSNNDIANGIVKGNLAELRAITINGNLHQLINENASIDDRRKFFVQFNERIKKFTNIAHDKIRRGERINEQEYINNRLEQWLLENAPQYQLKYIKKAVKA